MWRNGKLSAVLMEMWTVVALCKTGWNFLKKIKMNLRLTQQFHF